MLKSAVPPSFPIPFASSAGGGFIRAIPTASQIGIQNGAASLTDGFPPLNFQPVAAGGVPPFGEDFNGLMNQVTKWNQWQEAGGPVLFDATFSTAVGGYPQNAIVQSNVTPGKMWMSTVDNNTTNPDTISSANWTTPPGMNPSGTPVPSFSSTPTFGFVSANGLTIGNSSSNATGSNDGSTLFLFVAIWNEFPNSQCPILTSAGAPIARGANPYADFAANRQLTLPFMQGTSLIGVDQMGGVSTGRLAGVPVSLGSITVPGSFFGENLHSLGAAENGVHTHNATSTASSSSSDSGHNHAVTGSVLGGNASGGSAGGGNDTVQQHAGLGTATGFAVISTSTSVSTTINNNGSGTAHNTVQYSYGVYWKLAL